MAEIINLRLARKAKKRTDKAREAAGKRAKFGQTKAEKAVHELETKRMIHTLDGAKRGQD